MDVLVGVVLVFVGVVEVLLVPFPLEVVWLVVSDEDGGDDVGVAVGSVDEGGVVVEDGVVDVSDVGGGGVVAEPVEVGVVLVAVGGVVVLVSDMVVVRGKKRNGYGVSCLSSSHSKF